MVKTASASGSPLSVVPFLRDLNRKGKQDSPAARPAAKNIAIMGSTGSVGLNALRIVRTHPGKFRVRALAARKNAAALVEQALELRPDLVCLYEKEHALETEKKLKRRGIRVVAGPEGLLEISRMKDVEEIIFSMVGAAGLMPIFEAIRARKAVAVANKEPLVMAGELLVKTARRFKVPILPIDSEHSGLWQCLESARENNVLRLILTSSGGPFRNRKGSLSGVTVEEALNHPKWKMGPKITIDSATMMNKGLEVIEAANLFEIPSERIDVLIHPEAIIHAMVEFVDGTHIAHLGVTDMRLPIQYALSYPDRLYNHLPKLDFARHGTFHFQKPDMRRFPCLALGYEASRAGGTMPAVLNAANEVVVQAFLEKKISFTRIAKNIAAVMKRHRTLKSPDLKQILEADAWARREAEALL